MTSLSGPDTANVAMHVTMPILDGIPLRELAALRRDESVAFARFQRALRKGILERSSNESAEDAAERVQLEVLEPALDDIETRLNAAARSSSRQVTDALSVGAASVVVGLMTGVPLVSELGVAAAISSLPSTRRPAREARADVELHDMYFLWSLEERRALRKPVNPASHRR